MDPDLDPLLAGGSNSGRTQSWSFMTVGSISGFFFLESRNWVNCWRIRNPGEQMQQLIGVRPGVIIKLLADPQPR